MAKKEYRFNTDILAYEEVREPLRLRLYRVLRRGIVAFIGICIINLLYSFIFYTPKMYRIEHREAELMTRYKVLAEKIDITTRRVDELRHRDNNVYRSLFGADSLVIGGIYAPYPDSVYAHLAGDVHSDLMMRTWLDLDALGRKLYLQSVSFDQIQALALDREDMAASVPAIWPIDRRDLRNNIGAFGRRFHPIYHYYRMHSGIDLPADIGDAVYATGNGVVTEVDSGQVRRGYGRQVVVDHGFGYRTRYAHLSSFNVAAGQVVRRGEVIGKVGNTGASTGPHLHYEVIYMGNAVDPVNYFRRDMSEEEFDEVIQSARETTWEADEN